MLSATPLTAGPRSFRERPLSVSIPDEVFEEREEHDKLLGQSLQQSWEKARARFKKETGEDLGDYRSTKQGILGALKQQYGSDSKEAKRRDDIYGTVELILNGVELVAATAAQAASMVFGPAEMCFNALDVLLSIPRAVKKYAEDLQSLFKEISSYLNNFRIYDRIDRRGALDAALLTSNNEILITLVDMCMLAWKVIKSPIKTVLSNVFLKNDAIGAALGNFRDLVEKQNQLTSTMTLETVLKSETLSRQIMQRSGRIEETTTETNVIVRGLAAESAENKNIKVDRDRILKIDRNLDLNEAIVSAPLDELKSARTLLLEETVTLFENDSVFKDWHESSERRKLLYISGETSSGKTNVLSALAQQIEDEKRKLHAQQKEESKTTKVKDDRSIYLTYYSFGLAGKAKDRGKFDTPVHLALKVMAAQLARQSTRYASTLNDTVESVQKGQKTLQELWKALKLGDFRAPDNSVLYMFFDGLDQLKSSLQELGKVMKLSTSRKTSKVKDESLKFKIILTGKIGTSRKLAVEKLSVIHISEINQPLIRMYVDHRLQDLNIFQDDDEDSKERRARVLDVIPETSNGSFGIAAQKVKMIEEAVEEDADFEVLISNLQLATINTLADEGRKVLDRLSESSDLSTQHKEQLRELLIWAIYGKRRPELEELEATLYLQRNKKSLEPLKRKIEGRFEEALEIIDSTAYPRDRIEEAMYLPFDTGTSQTVHGGTPKVTVNVSVENADESSMRQFVSDLGNKIADVKFNFSSQKAVTSEANRLIFSQCDAECTIVARLLRALNDDRVRRQAASLIKYATYYLPGHLDAFQIYSMEHVPLEDLKSIGTALINFLWDSESIASAWDVHAFDWYEWLSDGNVHAIETILQYDRLLDNLDPVQRRWASKNNTKKVGKFAFLNTMASTAAVKWLTDSSQKVEAVACFSFIDGFLDLLARGDPLLYKQLGLASSQTPNAPPEVDRGEDSQLVDGDDIETDGPADGAVVNQSDPPVNGIASDNTNVNQHDEIHSSNEKSLVSTTLAAEPIGPIEPDESDEPVEPDEPLLGNFSASSTEIALAGTSILIAKCYNIDGRLMPASINLNDCLTNDWGQLRWKLDGNAFESAQNVRLSDDGTLLKLVLLDGHGGHRWQSINLDEQISNSDGRLVFLDNALNKKSNDVDDAGDAVSEPDITLTFSQRVKRAEDWAIKTLKTDLNSLALIRIGNTLLGEEVDVAIEYFNRAEPESQDPWKAVGLSRAYAVKEEFKNALESIQDALTIFRAQHGQAGQSKLASGEKAESESDGEVRDLFTCLNQVAQYQIKLGDEPAAIDFLEEALVCRPSASSCRWRLVGLLCKNDRHSRAEELFDEWEKGSKELNGESPTAFVRNKADSDSFYSELYPVVNFSKGTELYNRISKTFEDAIDEAERQERETDSSVLLHNRAIILASDGSEESLEAACQVWIDAHHISRDSEYPNDAVMYWSSKLAAMRYFDRAKEQLGSLPSMNNSDATAIIDKLKDDIMKIMTPYHKDHREYDRPTTYISALAQMADQHDYSKSFLKEDMTTAIEILTDEDIYNDASGVYILFQILLKHGDVEGALSAWSLYDRTDNRSRQQQRLHPELEEKEDVSETNPPENESANTKGDSDSNSHQGAEPEAKTDSDSRQPGDANPTEQPTEESEIEVDKYSYVCCDFCNKDLCSWAVDQEQWWCRYCPEVTFCTPCKDKLQLNQREKYVCGPNHDLVLVQHPDYNEEEIKGTNVRIGWKWENVQTAGTDGEMITKRERVGGRIVDLKEWVEILRVEWGVTATQSEGKVQL